MIKGRHKLIHYRGYEQEIEDELFDLENDPEELDNLYSTKKSISDDMMDELSAKLKAVNTI
jgi:hypothetical protein